MRPFSPGEAIHLILLMQNISFMLLGLTFQEHQRHLKNYLRHTSEDTSEYELLNMSVIKKEIVRRYTTMSDAPQMGFLTF